MMISVSADVAIEIRGRTSGRLRGNMEGSMKSDNMTCSQPGLAVNRTVLLKADISF